MKIFRLIGMVLIAMTLSFNLSSCDNDDDDDNFIAVDYSKDLVGTWTCLQPGFTEALVISADGSVLSTGVDADGTYWEDLKGTIEVKNNKMKLIFGEEDDFEGRFEIIPGETFVIIEPETGDRLTYRYCEKDFSEEILGQWVSINTISNTGKPNANNDMLIYNYKEDGTVIRTGYSYELKDFFLNKEASYKVIGDLLITKRLENTDGVSPYFSVRLTYSPDGIAYGDIMTYTLNLLVNDNVFEATSSFLRVKQHLELPGQKYNFIKTYVTNVKGLDKDIPFMGYNFNFAKMNSTGFDKFLKTILFSVEFPSADSIKYSCVLQGTPMSMTCPIEVEGNKMTVKMSERYAAYRDIDFYTYQDKDDSQMHMYMPTYTFENFFSNIQVGVMASRGELDLNDAAAVEAVHKSIADAVETINVSFVMSKSK